MKSKPLPRSSITGASGACLSCSMAAWSGSSAEATSSSCCPEQAPDALHGAAVGGLVAIPVWP